jgi:hypothetical protein
MKIQWLPSRRWHHENSVGALQVFRCIRSNENSVGAIKQVPSWKFGGCYPSIQMYSIQCNNVIIITVDRVGDLIISWSSLSLCRPLFWASRSSLYGPLFWPSVLSPAGKRDTRTHVLLGSIFISYFICYYGSASYFLSWSNWIGFIFSILIKLKRSYFEVQTKQLFWFVRLSKWTICCLYLFYHNGF